MQTHSYIPRDLDTGAETDAQTQGNPKATKPEKYTQTRQRTNRQIHSDPQTLTDIHTHASTIALPGDSSLSPQTQGRESG